MDIIVIFFIIRTHILHEEVDEALGDDGMRDDLLDRRFLGFNLVLIRGCGLHLSLGHLLLTEVHFRAQTLGRVFIQGVIARHGGFHDVGREESGHDTGCHDDGIEGRMRDIETITQRRDDERELTYLHK